MAERVFQPTLSEPRGTSQVQAPARAPGPMRTEEPSNLGAGLAQLAEIGTQFEKGRQARQEAQAEIQSERNEAAVALNAIDFVQGLEGRRSSLSRWMQGGDEVDGEGESGEVIVEEAERIGDALQQGVISDASARTQALARARQLIERYPGQADFINETFGIGGGRTNIAESVDVVDPLTEESVEYLNATQGNWTADDLRSERRRRVVLSESNLRLANAELEDFNNIQTSNLGAQLQGAWQQMQDVLPEQGGALTDDQFQRYSTAVDSAVNEQLQVLNQWAAEQGRQGAPVSSSRLTAMRDQIVQQGQTYKNLVTGEGQRGGESRLLRDRFGSFLTAQKNFLRSKSDYERVNLLAEVWGQLDAAGGASLNDILQLSDEQMVQLETMFPGQFEGMGGAGVTAAGVRGRIVQGLNRIVGSDEVPPGWENFYQTWVAKKSRVPQAGISETEANNFVDVLQDERFEAENYRDTLTHLDSVLTSTEGSLSGNQMRKVQDRVQGAMAQSVLTMQNTLAGQNFDFEITQDGVRVRAPESQRGEPPRRGPYVIDEEKIQRMMEGEQFSFSMQAQQALEDVNASLDFIRRHPEVFGNVDNVISDIREQVLGVREGAQGEQEAQQGGSTATGGNASPEGAQSPQEPTAGSILRNTLVRDEGVRREAYDDTRGNRTIGIGFNMDAAGAREHWEEAGIEKDFEAVKRGDESLTDEEIDRLFNSTMQEAADVVEEKFPNLPPNRKAALASMVFNAGPDILGPDITEAIRNQDWEAAEAEIRERSNRSQSRGIQNRREREADLFMGRGG